MAQLQAYEQYQPIDYDYVKQLPVDWRLLPNIAIFQERIERGHSNEELLSVTIGKGVIKQSDLDKKDSSTLDKSKYLLVYPDDLVYSMRFRQGASGYSNYKGIVSPACTVLKPRKGVMLNSRYYHYMIRTGFYKNYAERYAYGIADGQMPLRYTDFKRMYSIVPPLDTQNRIVEYLDKKNDEIDRFIRNKEKLIALLEEERRIIILSNITGGNIDASSKNDWKIIPLRYCCKVIDCKHITPVYVSEGIPIVSPGELKPYSINYSGLRLVSQHDYHEITEGGRKPINGDILYSRNASVGSACFVDGVTDFCMGQDVCLIRSKKFNGRYLEHVLNSDLILRRVESILIGATIRRINISEIKKLNVPFPPIEIQNLICSKIEISTKIIGTAISKAQQEITAIKEYREALITDLVTGKRSLPLS